MNQKSLPSPEEKTEKVSETPYSVWNPEEYPTIGAWKASLRSQALLKHYLEERNEDKNGNLSE